MLNFLKRLLGRNAAAEQDREALRAEFRARYHHFRLLLDNDREVHERMVDIEDALRGQTMFDMRFVRRVLTDTATSTFQVIKHLNALAPGRHDRLMERFKAVQANISGHMADKCTPGPGPSVMDLGEAGLEHVPLVGLKMAALAEAARVLNIPCSPGFVVTSEGVRRFMDHGGLREEVVRRIQAADMEDETEIFRLSSSLQQLIHDAELPENLAGEILRRFDRSVDRTGIAHAAVRSSALGEDQAGANFAGQYKSLLNVGRDELLRAYKEVVASKYGPQALAYRRNRGIRDEDTPMCVGVTAMVDAVAGGVAYSAGAVDPLDRDVSIYSVWGLPKSVVDGSAEADFFRVPRAEPLAISGKSIAEKPTMFVCRPDEGTRRVETDEGRKRLPSLTDEQVLGIARTALALDNHFGTPQDVEWAVDHAGTLILLQTRSLPRPMRYAPVGREQDESLPAPLASGGSTASPGIGCGPVHIARSQADLLLFPRGGVLVIKQALPSWAPVIHKAAAVVAELGTAAGHLANVAREFEVPALFGLADAKKILQPGQIVTVDADRRAVYEGRPDGLPETREETDSPMKGSSVYITLSGAARHILPLHLLDPESPEFRPRNCESLHDIIRFSHEKAVKEMFSFGREARFPEAAAKRLYSGGAKQFWVLNLDDGFDGPVDDKCVDLKHIVSIPMLALWEGMNTVPWEGPPPVNARGLMSVMFEATVNPALDPAMASRYASKNYFIISKNFASLQSRFGFHFCGAEALVGDRDAENYAGFRFQGGAANEARRVLRAELVAELLEDIDFRVRLRSDSVAARVEGFDRERMEARLRALGHLIIHTRQLDMIMNDRAEAARRKEKLRSEIRMLMKREPAAPTGGR